MEVMQWLKRLLRIGENRKDRTGPFIVALLDGARIAAIARTEVVDVRLLPGGGVRNIIRAVVPILQLHDSIRKIDGYEVRAPSIGMVLRQRLTTSNGESPLVIELRDEMRIKGNTITLDIPLEIK